MVSCIPCGGDTSARSNLNSCYPHSKELVAAGPDYKPLSQELSKLILFARRKPGQLTNVGEELETRISKEARGSTGGYAKSRASLLVSLAILKSLIAECSQDLSLFSRSALRAIVSALDVKVYQKGTPDLEVIGRAASCFTAFATYTDGTYVTSDKGIAKDYLSILARMGRMAVEADQEVSTTSEKLGPASLGQTRLIGITALRGASGSDALFSSLKDTTFTRQVDVIVPALLSTIFGAPMENVKTESTNVHQDPSNSPFFSEFTARRPVNDRRAPSIHGQIVNEKGPRTENALGSALRALKALMSRCQMQQASVVLDAVFAYLDRRGWTDVERSCWLADELTRFSDLQFRFVIPTRLVEQLAIIPDAAPSAKQSTLLAMITTILNSSIPLVGLGVSDVLNNLLTIIIRRIHVDERDSLLPPLVQCVTSLSANIHYADQINVMIEEISQRLTEISPTDKHRSEIMRVLVHCMIGVLTVVHAGDDRELARNPPTSPVSADKGKGPQIETPIEPSPVRQATKRRNLVAPQVWQDTLTLLCESSYAVRSVYARALLLFLEREMPREGGSARPKDLSVEMFCNALHAALYTLAMSACLGVGTSPGDDTPVESHLNSPVRNTENRLPNISNGETTGKGVSFNLVEPTPSATPNTTATPPNGQSTPPRESRRQFRRVSLPLNRLNSSSFIPLASFDNVATPLDFAYIVKILDTLHEVVPATALLTGGPMLFALDAAAGTELVRRPGDGRSGAWVLERKRGVRETVGLVWRGVGRKWGVDHIENLASKTLAALPEPYVIPPLYPPEDSEVLPAPDEPLSFAKNVTEGESSSATQPLLDSEVIVSALASSGMVQKATNRDATGIVKRLGAGWSVENALMNSIERFSSADTDSHFNTTNTLMSNSNPSYRSLINNQIPPNRAVGVADLRDALNQSHRQPQGNSAAPSIVSTIGTGGRSFVGEANGHGPMNGMSMGSGRKDDVREVLKDIFRDKKKAGGGIKGLTEAEKPVVA